MRFSVWFIICIIFIISGCIRKEHHQKSPDSKQVLEELPVEYARGFTIQKAGNSTLLSVRNPWQGAENVVYQYLLVPEGAKVPDGFSGIQIIRTPVKKIICMSTTYIAMVDLLGETATIKGISGIPAG